MASTSVGNASRTLNGLRGRRTEKISEAVAREIVHDIVAREVAVGQRLPSEAVMLAQYDVGRASLREALRILEVNGLVRIRSGPGGGPVVAGADASEFAHMTTLYLHVNRATFRELLDARAVIEPLLASEAALRHDDEGISRLRAALEIGEDLSNAKESKYLEASRQFHITVCGMSGNKVLDLFGQGLNAIFTARLQDAVRLPNRQRRAVEESHNGVGKAILEGDAEQAEELMREHLDDQHRWISRNAASILDEIVDWR